MRDRFLQQEVWERLGVPVRPTVRALLDQAPEDDVFQQMLFSKIVPNCKKLGLLDAGDGWLRQKFTEINVIQFEDWKDTGAEYEELDMVAADRAAAGRWRHELPLLRRRRQPITSPTSASTGPTSSTRWSPSSGRSCPRSSTASATTAPPG